MWGLDEIDQAIATMTPLTQNNVTSLETVRPIVPHYIKVQGSFFCHSTTQGCPMRMQEWHCTMSESMLLVGFYKLYNLFSKSKIPNLKAGCYLVNICLSVGSANDGLLENLFYSYMHKYIAYIMCMYSMYKYIAICNNFNINWHSHVISLLVCSTHWKYSFHSIAFVSLGWSSDPWKQTNKNKQPFGPLRSVHCLVNLISVLSSLHFVLPNIKQSVTPHCFHPVRCPLFWITSSNWSNMRMWSVEAADECT